MILTCGGNHHSYITSGMILTCEGVTVALTSGMILTCEGNHHSSNQWHDITFEGSLA